MPRPVLNLQEPLFHAVVTYPHFIQNYTIIVCTGDKVMKLSTLFIYPDNA
jgi:hypothetical protein